MSSRSQPQPKARAARTRLVGIIPARYQSTRFPGKMLEPLGGKPLIQHAWERASRARSLDRVIIATDDSRIAEAAGRFGAEVALTGSGHQSGSDRIAEVAARLDGVTHIVNLQGDEPNLPPSLIDQLALDLADHPERRMNTTARPFGPDEDPARPNSVKVVVDRNGDALYFSRAPIPHRRDPRADGGPRPLLHMGIYGFRLDTLLAFVRWRPSPLERCEMLEQLRALENGVPIRVVVTRFRTFGIDTPEDARRFAAYLEDRRRRRR